jgi:hypothetical protein
MTKKFLIGIVLAVNGMMNGAQSGKTSPEALRVSFSALTPNLLDKRFSSQDSPLSVYVASDGSSNKSPLSLTRELSSCVTEEVHTPLLQDPKTPPTPHLRRSTDLFNSELQKALVALKIAQQNFSIAFYNSIVPELRQISARLLNDAQRDLDRLYQSHVCEMVDIEMAAFQTHEPAPRFKKFCPIRSCHTADYTKPLLANGYEVLPQGLSATI